jgi:hypothetical protein
MYRMMKTVRPVRAGVHETEACSNEESEVLGADTWERERNSRALGEVTALNPSFEPAEVVQRFLTPPAPARTAASPVS